MYEAYVVLMQYFCLPLEQKVKHCFGFQEWLLLIVASGACISEKYVLSGYDIFPPRCFIWQIW